MVWWDVLAEQTGYPQLLAVAGMLALAGALLYIDFNRLEHRAFALLLIFRACVMLASVLRDLYVFSAPPEAGGVGDPGLAALFAGLAPYFVIAMPFLIVRFAAVYPRRRTIFGTTRWGALLLLAAALACELVYLVDHASYHSVVAATWTAADGTAWPIMTYVADGPLSFLLGLMLFGMSALTLVFVIDYLRLPAGPRKAGVFFVAIGFLINGVYDVTATVTSIVTSFGLLSSSIVVWLAVAGALPLIASLALLARAATGSDPRTSATQARHAMLLCLLPFASAIFGILNAFSSLGFVPLILTGFWRLWLPALVTYALVRHQLFDIDLKIKFALKQSTLAGLAFVGFVVMSETLEVIITSSTALRAAVPERWTDLASLGVAVGLTYALTPVKHFAGQVANRAMPNTQDTEDYLARKRLEVFRATLEGAVEDGDMTEREKLLVERLRLQLGLSDNDIQPVIAEVQAAYAGRTIGPRSGPAAAQ